MVLESDRMALVFAVSPTQDPLSLGWPSFAHSYRLCQRIVVLFILSRVGGINFQQNDTASSEMFICSARGGLFRWRWRFR